MNKTSTDPSHSLLADNMSYVEGMNRFYDLHIKGHDHTEYLRPFHALLDLVPHGTLLDVGCGSAMLSEHVQGFDYTGCDLQHVVSWCAKRNYPDLEYRNCDIRVSELSWMRRYDLVVANGLLDILPEPLVALDRLLSYSSNYLLIHRQEITDKGKTRPVEGPGYGSAKSYHSIISRSTFMQVVKLHSFKVVKEVKCNFANWENGGCSFLLKRK